MPDILSALETEYERLKNEIQITENTFFVLLADKYLDRHLSDLGLPLGSDGLEEKRSRILARLRGIGTVTKAMLKNVANAYVDGQIEILEFPSEYMFGIKFISKKGRPPNLDDLMSVIEEIKPAHLAVEYIFTYRIWQDIINILGDWQTVKNHTWDWLLTFDNHNNIIIDGEKIYYCPSGYGNAMAVWVGNRPYARPVS